MDRHFKSTLALGGTTVCLLVLSLAFYLDSWGHLGSLPVIPLADPVFTNTATVRVSGAELIRTGGDASGLDCYACHERTKPVVLKFDTAHKVILAPEHEDIIMGHGRHNRNNDCFNCHDERNLELLQARDGRELKLVESTPLCGSCHGPTYRDWEAGVHGRTSGNWNSRIGPIRREDCVSCHDPHTPKFPPQKPAPAPNPLRQISGARPSVESRH